MRPLLLTALLLLSGCCLPIQHGSTTHHLVIGLGIVSVNNYSPLAQVTKTTALGVYGSTGLSPALVVGVGTKTVTSIATNSNVIIEVKQLPGKPLTITVP